MPPFNLDNAETYRDFDHELSGGRWYHTSSLPAIDKVNKDFYESWLRKNSPQRTRTFYLTKEILIKTKTLSKQYQLDSTKFRAFVFISWTDTISLTKNSIFYRRMASKLRHDIRMVSLHFSIRDPHVKTIISDIIMWKKLNFRGKIKLEFIRFEKPCSVIEKTQII